MKRLVILILAAVLTGSAAYATDAPDGAQPMLDPTIVAMGETVMTADLLPSAGSKMSRGKMVQRAWTGKDQMAHESFRIDVMIPIPNEALGIDTLADALDADVRATISRHGVEVQCLLAVQPIFAKSYVAFAVELVSMDDFVKPMKGVCDIDIYQDGIQVGMPVLLHGDYINSTVTNSSFKYLEFLGGYCD